MGLLQYVFNQPEVRVLVALIRSQNGRSLRELADLTELSVGGIQHITNKLRRHGMVTAARSANRVMFRISASPQEQELVMKLYDTAQVSGALQRAEKLSARIADRMEWIEATLSDVEEIRRNVRRSASSAARDRTSSQQ